MRVSRFVVAGVVATSMSAFGCVAAKDARIAVENAVDPKTVQEEPWGRVECGEGQVCSEVSVARVDVHREGGPVEVTLENKTLESVAVQVQVERFDDEGHRVDRTGFADVALAPRQESVLSVWQDVTLKDKLVIRLRAR